MTYKYKKDQITQQKAKCSIRRDKMIPHFHYDPNNTAEFAADRATNTSSLSIAADV